MTEIFPLDILEMVVYKMLLTFRVGSRENYFAAFHFDICRQEPLMVFISLEKESKPPVQHLPNRNTNVNG